MVINTKFNRKDNVFFLQNNTITTGVIEEIKVRINTVTDSKYSQSIEYGIAISTDSLLSRKPENEIFSTKKEVLASL